MNVTIDQHVIPGQACVYFAFSEKQTGSVGRALVVEENNECLLWDIMVNSEYRRKGYATALLTAIKHENDAIVTSYISKEGKLLCFKNDFKFEESQSGMRQLVWRREKTNASENNKDEWKIQSNNTPRNKSKGDNKEKS